MAAGPAPAIDKAVVTGRLPTHATLTVQAIIAAQEVAGLTLTAILAATIIVLATGALVADRAVAVAANQQRSRFHHPSFQRPGG